MTEPSSATDSEDALHHFAMLMFPKKFIGIEQEEIPGKERKGYEKYRFRITNPGFLKDPQYWQYRHGLNELADSDAEPEMFREYVKQNRVLFADADLRDLLTLSDQEVSDVLDAIKKDRRKFLEEQLQ